MIEIENLAAYRVQEVELVYHPCKTMPEKIRVLSSEMAWAVLKATWDENKIGLVEQFKILLLDTAHNCIGVSTISTGGITATLADPRIVYATALKAKATALILAHNHPSGNLLPSADDLVTTKRLIDAGKILNIDVLEHIIMTPDSYYSMKDGGLMP